jgi:Flp pilus assembly protein TadG
MRRVTGDEGAVAVLFGVLLAALLGLMAMVVDTGRLVGERFQLQNAADAAALAVGMDCAQRVDLTESCDDVHGTAATYLSLNYGSVLHPVVTPGPFEGTVRVGVTNSSLALTGVHTASAPVSATAHAEWAIASSGQTRPFAVHACAFDAASMGDDVVLRIRPPAGIRDRPSCDSRSGNAAWLSSSETCSLESRITDQRSQDAGLDGCLHEGHVEPVIVFRDCSACEAIGQQEVYEVLGFAFLHVDRVDMSPVACPPTDEEDKESPGPLPGPPFGPAELPEPTVPAMGCVRGRFVNGVLSPRGAWSDRSGPSLEDFGARAVRLWLP